jgi:hypothetical protein
VSSQKSDLILSSNCSVNCAQNVLNGNGALALIYTDGLDFSSGLDPNSQTVTIAP